MLESVGGQVLANVLGMVAPFGMVVSYGTSAGGPVTFDSTAVLRSRLTLTGLAVAYSSFTLPFTVAPYSSVNPGVRYGRITFGGQVHTVKQTSW